MCHTCQDSQLLQDGWACVHARDDQQRGFRNSRHSQTLPTPHARHAPELPPACRHFLYAHLLTHLAATHLATATTPLPHHRRPDCHLSRLSPLLYTHRGKRMRLASYPPRPSSSKSELRACKQGAEEALTKSSASNHSRTFTCHPNPLLLSSHTALLRRPLPAAPGAAARPGKIVAGYPAAPHRAWCPPLKEATRNQEKRHAERLPRSSWRLK